MNTRKLNNPPIIQVIVAIQLKDMFISQEDITNFYENTAIKKMYPKKEEIKSVLFELGETPKISNQVTEIYNFSKESNLERIQVGQGKVIFVDENKYEKFEIFINKLKKIVDCIKKYYKKELFISELGLRYVNEFKMSIENRKKYFKIDSQLNINDKNNEEFALLKNCMHIVNIDSVSDDNISATVKVLFKNNNNNSSNIVFDIEARSKRNISNEVDFDEELAMLRNFKNEIFYSNFSSIDEIKDFQ